MVNIKVLTEHICPYCKHKLRTAPGIKRHISKCSKKPTDRKSPVNDIQQTPLASRPDEIVTSTSNKTSEVVLDDDPVITPNFPIIEVWPINNVADAEFINLISNTYDEIVHYRRNLFNVPSGKAGKEFIDELTHWLRHFNTSSNLNSIAIKAFMVLPSLMLQKPTSKSKAKEHSECLLRRLKQWKNRDLEQILKEVRLIQKRFKSNKKTKSTEDISRIFGKLVMEGKISAALKFLDNESSCGVLQYSETVVAELKEKHPKLEPATKESLLHGPIDQILPYLFNSIDEQAVLQCAIRTKGSAAPSGMDAELYRRILCSKSFNSSGKALREEIAILAKNILLKSYDPVLLEGYVASRVIPLDKNPGIRPIGVGEVLRRIIGKVISHNAKEEILSAAGPLQTCAGQGAGAEAEIHAMQSIFLNESTDAVLLIDASNAFNCMNRMVGLHNIRITCPTISTYLINTYRYPTRLFISGGGEILSLEGTTQGDPLAMAWCSLNTVTIINKLMSSLPEIKQVWLADDATAAGKIRSLHLWYELLIKEGKKFGYFVNGGKSWLIVKSEQLKTEAHVVFGKTVNITCEGKRHLGAVIGSDAYRKIYCDEIVSNWVSQLKVLCEIAKTQPQAAYTAYTKGFKSKFTYFLRTINNFELFIPPVDELISNEFIPTLFDLVIPLNKNYRSNYFSKTQRRWVRDTDP